MPPPAGLARGRRAGVGRSPTPRLRYAVGALGSLLRQPVDADQFAPVKWVYHVPVRSHPHDPALTDEQWADVAREMVSSLGLASADDPAGCRWVAMRHGPDHIHIVVTLSRQDGARADLHNDFYRMRAACHRVEERYGLRRTAPADATADVAATSRETSEALRVGAVAAAAVAARTPGRVPGRTPSAGSAGRRERPATVRDILRQRVQRAAAGSSDLGQFRSLLAEAGVDVHLRMSTRDGREGDEVTGVSFSLAGGKTDRSGQPIKFSGSKLAPDLSWRQIAARWLLTTDATDQVDQGSGPATAPGGTTAMDEQQVAWVAWGSDEESIWAEAERIMHEAADRIRAEGMTDPDGAGDAAWAAADTARSAAYLLEGEGGGPLTDAADAMARAGRDSYRRIPHRSDTGAGLRAAGRMMAHAARITGTSTGTGTKTSAAVRSQAQLTALVTALTALSRSVADLREAQHRAHQAQIARQVATHLRAVAPTVPIPPETSSRPRTHSDGAPATGRRWRTSAFDDAKRTRGSSDDERQPPRGATRSPDRGSDRSPGRGPDRSPGRGAGAHARPSSPCPEMDCGGGPRGRRSACVLRRRRGGGEHQGDGRPWRLTSRPRPADVYKALLRTLKIRGRGTLTT